MKPSIMLFINHQLEFEETNFKICCCEGQFYAADALCPKIGLACQDTMSSIWKQVPIYIQLMSNF